MEVRPCEWPSDDFLRRAGIYEDFYLLIENAGLTNFLHDQRHQYLLLTNTFVQNFYFFPKKSPPTVEFHLYDVAKEMTLAEFCEVCRIPFEGTLDEPHRNEVEAFINTITVGETRKVSDARITSIHFPVLRYFALLASRCLIGRGNRGNLSIPDIIILFHGLYRDNTVSMGGIIARRLSLNRTKGPIFGGIYASRLAEYFEIPIRHEEKEETSLPRAYLDYKSMIAHVFLVKSREGELKYKLYFDKHHPETITLPAPSLFNLSAGTHIVPWAAVQAYRNPAPAPEPEPQDEPPRLSVYSWDPEEVASQWQSESSSSQYDPSYTYGYPPGYPWQ